MIRIYFLKKKKNLFSFKKGLKFWFYLIDKKKNSQSIIDLAWDCCSF